MNSRWPAGRLFRLLAAALLVLSGVLTGIGPATASAACPSRPGTQPPSPGASFNSLNGVAVLSACNAWAVGTDTDGSTPSRTLIEHWNGSAWSVVRSPSPGSVSNGLLSVAAVSATNIWAVGFSSGHSGTRTLVLHWNGAAWAKMRSPSPGSKSSVLRAVHAASASDTWAVGDSASGGARSTLIEHWNGSSWTVQPSPNPGRAAGNFLYDVTATSRTSAWAVGQILGSTVATHSRTVILHWNGMAWSHVPSPNPGTGNGLFGVAATSASNAWAVGVFSNGPANQTLIVRWNGQAWVRVPSPDPGGPGNDNSLTGVAVTSASNALAVGSFSTSGVNARTLVLRWNGHLWARLASPSPGIANGLFAVAASSASNAWAVGGFFPAGGPYLALAIPCC